MADYWMEWWNRLWSRNWWLMMMAMGMAICIFGICIIDCVPSLLNFFPISLPISFIHHFYPFYGLSRMTSGLKMMYDYYFLCQWQLWPALLLNKIGNFVEWGGIMAMQSGMGLSKIIIIAGAGIYFFPLFPLSLRHRSFWMMILHFIWGFDTFFFFALCVTGYTGAIVLKDKDLSDIVGLLQVGTFFLLYVLYVHYFLSVFFVYSYLLCILLRSFWPKLLLFSRQVVDFNVLEFRQFGLEVSTSFKIFVFYVDIILDQ